MSSNTRFTLATGREIQLQSLNQSLVYAGLLEGVPTVEMNERTMKSLCAEARKRFGDEPHLIRPVQEPIELRGRYPFGTPARLPSVSCVGRFLSYKPARDPTQDLSVLTVIWFQPEYAFPLSETAEQAIRSIDWEGLATDGEW